MPLLREVKRADGAGVLLFFLTALTRRFLAHFKSVSIILLHYKCITYVNTLMMTSCLDLLLF